MGLKKPIILLLLFATTAAANPIEAPSEKKTPTQFHEAEYKLGWDIHFSPYAGGEDLLFVHRSLERAGGYFIENKPVRYTKNGRGVLWRLSDLMAVWLPLNCLVVTIQHEVFGHGYRIREIGYSKADVTGYEIGVPLPYGEGGGSTSYSYSNELTTTDETAISMAGVESTAILSQLTALHWLEANRIDPRQSMLYLDARYDLPLYIGTVKTRGGHDGHDITGYLQTLNQTYTSHYLSGARLRSLSWINLADPLTYYALYSWGRYIGCGKETIIPMIPVGHGYRYLPSVRLGLTPFGPEVFFDNYLLKGSCPTYFYLKGGGHSDNTYLGIGAYAPSIWKLNKWSFGARFDAWRQPKLLLQPGRLPISVIDFFQMPDKNNPLYPYSEQHAIRYGAAGSVICSYKSAGRSGFQGEIGYKAQGFLPGYSLKASPVIRTYYTLVF